MASTSKTAESECDSPTVEASQACPEKRASRASARALLAGATPREVLARLIAGDPLELRARVASGLASEALFLDPDRAFLRTAAHVARFAPRYRGQPELDAWLDARVQAALRELAEEEREQSAHGRAAPTALAELAGKLKFEPAALARACVALNGCERLERRAFRALVIEAREIDVAARELGSAPSETGRAARRALEAALAALGQGSAE
jgi:hypothetical protein